MTRHRAAILLLALLASTTTTAQSGWQTHTRAGEWAFAQGDVKHAEAEFKTALTIAQDFPAGDQRLETSLENLARLYELGSDFDRAQPHYQLLLVAKESRLGQDDPALLDTLVAVARVSQPMGDLPTAQESLQRYAHIAELSQKADPAQWWRVLVTLARTETIQDHAEEALEWQRKAAEVMAIDPRATESERAEVLESLAHMEIVAGEGRRAELLLNEVAELRKVEDEADAAGSTLAHAAEVAFAAGEIEIAERFAMKALNLAPNAEAEFASRRVLADASWMRVNRGTDNLADLMLAAKDSEELTRARDRLRAVLILEGESNAETLAKLVQVDVLRGHPDEASQWQQRLLAQVELVEGTSSRSAVKARRDLVLLLVAAGRNEEALEENSIVLNAMEIEYGPQDLRLVPVLEQQLDLLTRVGRKKDAKAVKKRLKKISRN
jgi:tetratricopeptide (TPR) repeat protein